MTIKKLFLIFLFANLNAPPAKAFTIAKNIGPGRANECNVHPANFYLSNSDEISKLTKLLSATESVPALKCAKGGGSGVVISDRCHILTNVHVIQRCLPALNEDIPVAELRATRFPLALNGQKVSVELVATGYPDVAKWRNLDTRDNSTKDWAIIKVDSLACGKCLPVGHARTGDQVWALGYPGPTWGLEKDAVPFDGYELANPPRARPLHFSGGPLLNNPEESQASEFWKETLASQPLGLPNQSFLFADLTVNGGNSGGPLLTEEAELLGIATVAVFRDVLRSGPPKLGNGAFLKIDEIKKQLPSEIFKDAFACSQ